jgi:beta-phosphoglucomutase-like phosphatase (HAD superfamily)
MACINAFWLGREALEQIGLQFSSASIHRRIGMSGNLIFRSCMRESGRQLSSEEIEHVDKLHSDASLRRVSEVHPLRDASELLSTFSKLSVPFAIGASGKRGHAQPSLDLLGVSHGPRWLPGMKYGAQNPLPIYFCPAPGVWEQTSRIA